MTRVPRSARGEAEGKWVALRSSQCLELAHYRSPRRRTCWRFGRRRYEVFGIRAKRVRIFLITDVGGPVWWLRLGLAIERIQPGHPQQNGRPERMHLTLKKEATRPPDMNSLQQQARFDVFVQEFNTERPHEALAMKTPAETYSDRINALWWLAGADLSAA